MTTADSDTDDQPYPGRERDHEHDDGDRRCLGRDEPRASDRMGEHEPHDPVLLFARGRGRGPGDRQAPDHERAVDRSDLAAEPAGDRAVVTATQQVGDALRNVERPDRVPDRREQRTYGDHHGDQAEARQDRGGQSQAQRDPGGGQAHAPPSAL